MGDRTRDRAAIDGYTLRADDWLHDITAERVDLSYCRSELVSEAARRPRISRVEVKDLEVYACRPRGLVLEDVTVDGLRIVRDPLFFRGCEFTRVTFRGHVRGALEIHPDINKPVREGPDFRSIHGAALRERFARDEWMIDISDAVGEIAIRGYPPRLIRRNPDITAVVPRANVVTSEWTQHLVEFCFSPMLKDALTSEGEDVLLIANPKGRWFKEEMQTIEALRDAGIALPS